MRSDLKHLELLYEELEWRRCAKDADYFFRTYVYTVDKNSETGQSKFEMTDYQREDLEILENNKEVYILKARQLGISTLMYSGYALWKLVFRRGFNIITTSKSQEAAGENNTKLKESFNLLPTFMKEKFSVESKNVKSFQIRHKRSGRVSKMNSLAATETVGAGDTYNLAILDEYALSSYQDDVLNTIKPAIQIAMKRSKSACLVILSTARGGSNAFAKMFKAAWKGLMSAKAIFHPWFVSPWFTQEDYDRELIDKTNSGKPWLIFSEYPSSVEEAFRQSGNPLFRYLPEEDTLEEFQFTGRIVQQSNGLMDVFLFEHDDTGPLHLAIDPEDVSDLEFYCISVDPSSGEGGDYQAAQILRLNEDSGYDRPEIVGYYHSNTVKPEELASDLNKIGRFFANIHMPAMIAVEQQGGYGELLINKLTTEHEYDNPYRHIPVGPSKSSAKKTAIKPFRFPMSQSIREAILANLNAELMPVNANTGLAAEPKIIGMYPKLRNELGTFVKQQTPSGQVKYSADVGCNDDLVMSLAIGVWMLQNNYQSVSAQNSTLSEAPKTDYQLWWEERQQRMQGTFVPDYGADNEMIDIRV